MTFHKTLPKLFNPLKHGTESHSVNIGYMFCIYVYTKININMSHQVLDPILFMNFESWIVASYQVGRRSPRMNCMPESIIYHILYVLNSKNA